MVGGDERLIAAHHKAVRKALVVAENYSATRVRLDGANENRTTGNWIVAAYRHDTSRDLDPQLHTHAVTANLTYDGVEGRWKALQASGLYERRAYLTEVYRNALANEVWPTTPLSIGARSPLRSISKPESIELFGFDVYTVRPNLPITSQQVAWPPVGRAFERTRREPFQFS